MVETDGARKLKTLTHHVKLIDRDEKPLEVLTTHNNQQAQDTLAKFRKLVTLGEADKIVYKIY